jgi:hypothetical protein
VAEESTLSVIRKEGSISTSGGATQWRQILYDDTIIINGRWYSSNVYRLEYLGYWMRWDVILLNNNLLDYDDLK